VEWMFWSGMGVLEDYIEMNLQEVQQASTAKA
jgi:hypothetical protein